MSSAGRAGNGQVITMRRLIPFALRNSRPIVWAQKSATDQKASTAIISCPLHAITALLLLLCVGECVCVCVGTYDPLLSCFVVHNCFFHLSFVAFSQTTFVDQKLEKFFINFHMTFVLLFISIRFISFAFVLFHSFHFRFHCICIVTRLPDFHSACCAVQLGLFSVVVAVVLLLPANKNIYFEIKWEFCNLNCQSEMQNYKLKAIHHGSF